MQKLDIIEYFGSVRSTALVFGITTQAVYAWPDKVHKHIALEANQISEGKLKYNSADYK